MARWIDADALRDRFQNLAYDDWNQGTGTTWANAFAEAADMVDDMPAADVAPVRHGRWEQLHGYVTPGGDPVWCCSECGKGIHVWGIEGRTYCGDIADEQWVACPNCGAKMDERSGDE